LGSIFGLLVFLFGLLVFYCLTFWIRLELLGTSFGIFTILKEESGVYLVLL
jgi:hypothetical protein